MSNSIGLRGIIKEHIPQHVEEILREEKILGKYVENIYQYIIRTYPNANMYVKRRMARNLADFRSSIGFDMANTPEGYLFWNEIENKILARYEQLL